MKSVIVLTVLLVATSQAQENLQQAEAPEGDILAQPNVWLKPGLIPRPPERPWLPWSAEQRDERQLTGEEQGKLNENLPEASNYGASAICCVRFCICGKRKKRSIVSPVQAIEDYRLRRFEILGSATELKLYDALEDLRELYNTPVSRIELYERPLDPATPAPVAQALGYKQSAVVATLKDGRRFMVVKGNRQGQGRQTILILGDHMTDDWVKVGTKNITHSVLLDFANAGGLSFDALHDNGKDAAMRMMAVE
jgi:hypothetical protein